MVLLIQCLYYVQTQFVLQSILKSISNVSNNIEMAPLEISFRAFIGFSGIIFMIFKHHCLKI